MARHHIDGGLAIGNGFFALLFAVLAIVHKRCGE